MKLYNNFLYLYNLSKFIESKYPANIDELLYLYDREIHIIEQNNLDVAFCISINTFFLNLRVNINNWGQIKIIIEKIGSVENLVKLHMEYSDLSEDVYCVISGQITPRNKFCANIVGSYNAYLLRKVLDNINEFTIIYKEIEKFSKMFS
jgi:hypothetical protein